MQICSEIDPAKMDNQRKSMDNFPVAIFRVYGQACLYSICLPENICGKSMSLNLAFDTLVNKSQDWLSEKS
jgi:hypothetical protein